MQDYTSGDPILAGLFILVVGYVVWGLFNNRS